jgi:hypothetical protein
MALLFAARGESLIGTWNIEPTDAIATARFMLVQQRAWSTYCRTDINFDHTDRYTTLAPRTNKVIVTWVLEPMCENDAVSTYSLHLQCYPCLLKIAYVQLLQLYNSCTDQILLK